MAAKGRVCDVTGSEFYTPPDGPYAILVGKDASMALGKMQLNPAYLQDEDGTTALHWSRDLNEKELGVLQDWAEKFEAKYPIVGYLQNDEVHE